MARRDRDHRDDRRRYDYDDTYDRDEGETYGQYGNLHRGLGYGGGRDPENLEGFGHGRDPDRYPRGGRRYRGEGGPYGRGYGNRDHEDRDYGERRYETRHGPGWQEPGWHHEAETRGLDDPTRRGERSFTDRAGDEVASWFGDQEAARRREADHRGKGPRGYRRSDERILEDVHDRLTDDPGVDATDISVSVQEGEVTLSGKVHSRRAKRAAEDCADSVSGVSHVQNNLRVVPTST
jgi:osmotically-inducible protein OsmY